MDKIESMENKIKYSTFGKTRKVKANRKMSNGMKAKMNCEDVLRRQSEEMEKEILKVKETKQGRVGQVFKMKGNIIGHKKDGTEPHAIKDPVTGELLVANEDIKKATLAYCVDNLKKKSDFDTGMYSCNELKKLVIENKFRNASKEPLKI